MRKILMFLLKFFIAAALIFAAGYYSFNRVMSAVVHTKKETIIPDVKGKSAAEALDILAAAGLGVKKEGEEFNQSVPPGVILRQSPPAGMNVKEGKVIKVVISQGGEMIYVPDLVGQTVRAADIILKASSLMIGEVSKQYSLIAEKGMVLSQDPPAAAPSEKDAVINIVISDGLPPDDVKLMPDFKGKNIEEAKDWAKNSGAIIEIAEEETADFPAGEILRQIPQPDADLSKTEKIIFYAASKKQSQSGGELIFNYSLASTGGSKRVKLVLIDDTGEKDILNAVRKPGAKISIPIKSTGKASVKVYLNKKFAEEIELN